MMEQQETHVRLHSYESPGQRKLSSWLKGKGMKKKSGVSELGFFDAPLLRDQQSVTERHRGPLVNL